MHTPLQVSMEETVWGVVNKMFFERGKRAVFEKCVENLTKLVI
jgi:hypothetical protein